SELAPLAEDLEELEACRVFVEEEAAVRGGHHSGTGLLDATHSHTKVFGLADYRDAGGVQLLHQDVGDLARQPLLKLQPTRVDLDDARQLADSDNSSSWDVADVED